MKRLSSVLFPALLALATTVAGQSSTDRDQVVYDVRAVSRALYGGDVPALLKYSHPKSIEAMGGTERAKASLEKATTYFRGQGLSVISLEFPTPPEFIAGAEGRVYAVIPTKTIVAGKGGRVLSWNFQLGVREATSKAWVYLEGSRLTPEIMATWIPDFPKDHQLPRVSREGMNSREHR